VNEWFTLNKEILFTFCMKMWCTFKEWKIVHIFTQFPSSNNDDIVVSCVG
jgi:hypothetical protein